MFPPSPLSVCAPMIPLFAQTLPEVMCVVAFRLFEFKLAETVTRLLDLLKTNAADPPNDSSSLN